jgi:SSS family solute:Na+ symporter
LRDAGVITIPELFEKRFGSHVRWLAGLVVVLGGVLNMGIFLRLGGEFLMHVTGFDPTATFQIALAGATFEVGWLEVLMTVLLLIVLSYTVLGGMLSVLVTDWIQFIVMGVGIVTTCVIVLMHIGWMEIVTVLPEARAATLAGEAPQGLKMGSPFNPIAEDGLGWMYVAWQFMFQIAVVCTWQTTIARVLSARDSATAKRMYRRTAFYFVGRFALPGLWGAAAFVYFWNRGGLPEGVTDLTAMPAYLETILPVGVIGILIAAMLAAEMSTDSGYLLTWATVIYNDIICPVLRHPLSARGKLLLVRSMVLLIGLFLLIYGLWYEIPGRAWDYLAVTGNIYMASVFTLLIGALYWRGANSWGAVSAIVLGAIGPITFLVVNAVVEDPARQIKPEVAGFAAFGMAFAGMFFGSMLGRVMGAEDGSAPEKQDQQG